MPRKPRLIIPDFPHHVVQRGNNRQNIFFCDIDKRYFLKQMRIYANENKIGVSAYCIMTNHIHLLVYPSTKVGMIEFMKMIAQKYSQYVNRRYNRSGKLWENRYKMHVVDPVNVLQVIRYIDLNPVRAHMVDRGESYNFSSCYAHVRGVSDNNITRDVINGMNENSLEYLQLKHENISTEEIRNTLQQEKIFGEQDFIKTLEKKMGRILSFRNRGRPRKSISSLYCKKGV